MPIPDFIHPLRIPFTLEIAQGRKLDRFVYAYLIFGQRITLIDCGVAGSETVIFDDLKAAGRAPEEISLVILTHAHPDHIGSLKRIKSVTGCRVTAHVDSVPWIEDVELQYRQRPVPSFHDLVGGSAPVDMHLHDGDAVELGDGKSLSVLHTPGHANGHICLWDREEGILFLGDAIPAPGSLPIYDDPLAVMQSLRKLRSIENLRVLFSSWDEPRCDDICAHIDAGMAYVRHIHEMVLQEKARETDTQQLTERVLARLGFPPMPISPLLVRSIEAHLKLGQSGEIRSLLT